MNSILVFLGVMVCLVLLGCFLSKDKKPPSGNCRNCPEYRYCGGGRSRCARRQEIRK